MFSVSDIFLKISIKKYLKKLNNSMLNQVYINESKKNPKSHVDNVYIQCCVNELKKRGKV